MINFAGFLRIIWGEQLNMRFSPRRPEVRYQFTSN
jgi:hypothetical protein